MSEPSAPSSGPQSGQQSAGSQSDALKLVALDAEDLSIISAHCQDAVLRIDDIAYVKSAQRFALIINRFDWQEALEKNNDKSYRRRRAALRFERVTAVQRKQINPAKKNEVRALIAISFEEQEPPSGAIRLIFAGGSEIRLDVECVEAELQDLGAVWETGSKPDHKLDE